MSDYIELLSKGKQLKIELCHPGTYYQGTRFDWSGVFRRISFNGTLYADEWFDDKTELSHDRVCGPSEEFFSAIGYEEAKPGNLFLKMGIGLLEKDTMDEYDAFHLYRIVEHGSWSVKNDSLSATFIHEMDGIYKYEKIVRITGENSFEILHRLTNTGNKLLSTQNYCHNFFNVDNRRTGPDTFFELDFHPEGKWRENSIHGYVKDNSFRFDAEMPLGRDTYLNGVIPPQRSDYSVTVNCLGGAKKVKISCDHPASQWAFWANARVATPEPFVRIDIEPGKSASWTTNYKLF